MEKIEKDDNFNAKFGISLEESASFLTKGVSGFQIEAPWGRWNLHR